MKIRMLNTEDSQIVWRINEEGLPGVGEVSASAIANLITLSALPLGAFNEQGELLGFVLCLLPGTSYASLNYAWFNKHYEDFVYIDRIAVSEANRNCNIGTILYAKVMAYANELQCPIMAEVNLVPPNPGSMRFHHRQGFTEVGTVQHKHYQVAMLMRENQ